MGGGKEVLPGRPQVMMIESLPGKSVRARSRPGRIRLHLFERQPHLEKECADRAKDKAFKTIESKGSQ